MLTHELSTSGALNILCRTNGEYTMYNNLTQIEKAIQNAREELKEEVGGIMSEGMG